MMIKRVSRNINCWW